MSTSALLSLPESVIVNIISYLDYVYLRFTVASTCSYLRKLVLTENQLKHSLVFNEGFFERSGQRSTFLGLLGCLSPVKRLELTVMGLDSRGHMCHTEHCDRLNCKETVCCLVRQCSQLRVMNLRVSHQHWRFFNKHLLQCLSATLSRVEIGGRNCSIEFGQSFFAVLASRCPFLKYLSISTSVVSWRYPFVPEDFDSFVGLQHLDISKADLCHMPRAEGSHVLAKALKSLSSSLEGLTTSTILIPSLTQVLASCIKLTRLDTRMAELNFPPLFSRLTVLDITFEMPDDSLAVSASGLLDWSILTSIRELHLSSVSNSNALSFPTEQDKLGPLTPQSFNQLISTLKGKLRKLACFGCFSDPLTEINASHLIKTQPGLTELYLAPVLPNFVLTLGSKYNVVSSYIELMGSPHEDWGSYVEQVGKERACLLSGNPAKALIRLLPNYENLTDNFLSQDYEEVIDNFSFTKSYYNQ